MMSWNEIASNVNEYKQKWDDNIQGEDSLLAHKTKLLRQYALKGMISDFDSEIMIAVMDIITVNEDGRLQIKFYDGTAFECETEK
jgi:hypothetical protein